MKIRIHKPKPQIESNEIANKLAEACQMQDDERLQEAADVLEDLIQRLASDDREHKLEAFEMLECIYASLADGEDSLENKVTQI